jgi:hypothetical protein
MTDREGVPPTGGAPDRSPPEARPAAGDPAVAPDSGDEPIAQRADAASDRGADRDAEAFVSPPTEPTLRADPAVREFEVPFDTGELQRVPTGQLLVVHRQELPDRASADDEEQDDTQRRVYSWVAAVIGVIGAAASLFVGWMLPLSIAALVFGVLGLRREEEGRTLAFVGIGTGIAGLVFSAVWIGYYAIVFGALPH